jgi:prepilin-type N-terminal cleavage/methylation domain-containing protein
MRFTKGFTLVELIVAASVLATLMLAAAGPFVSMVEFRRNTANQADINDNLKLIVSVIDKEVRTASADSATFSVSADQRSVTFENQFGDEVTYTFDPVDKKISKTIPGTPSPETYDITSVDALYIQEIVFRIDGLTNDEPPIFTMRVEASSDNAGLENVVSIQNTTLLRNRAP